MSLGALYKRALESAVAGQAKVYNYSNETDFAALWGTSQQPPSVPSQLDNWGKEDLAFVVVWDGGLPTAAPSADDRLLFKHLTPLDWALAYSSRVLGTDNLKTQATFAIVIVDLTSQRDADLWSTRMRYQLLADMPWVTVCAPLPVLVDSTTRVGLRLCLPIVNTASETATHESSASQVWNAASLLGRAEDGNWRIVDTAIATTLAKAPAGGTGVRLRDLGRQWAASLAQVDEHHDLNNIVGPYLIADLVGISRPEKVRDAKSPVEPLLIDAFLTHLKWAGLIGSHDQSNAPKVDYTPPHFAEKLNLIAVDDRLDRGWSEVLAFMLGVQATTKANDQIQQLGSSSQVQLLGTKTPHTLLASLGISVTDQGAEVELDRYGRRLYDSPVAESNERPWALVLDLRLFAEKPDEARDWYLILARAAIALCNIETELAWPGFAADLPSLERWIDPVRSNRVDPRAPTDQSLALSLLARLCALRWPCTPILLFSSTARRDLIERLAPYGNIFLAGAKPALIDPDPAGKLKTFLNSWGAELLAVQRLLQVQQRILTLRFADKAIGGQCPDGRHVHITIALDETGNFVSNEVSAIGGICLLSSAADELSAKRQSANFSERLRKAGVNFYTEPPYYTDLMAPGSRNASYISKGTEVGDVITKVRDEFRDGIEIGVVRYLISKKDYIEGGNAHHAAYLSGLARLLSLILIEMLPSLGIVYGRNCTIAIWLPVKQTSHSELPKDGAARGIALSAKAFSERYDLRVTFPGGDLVETVGGYGNAFAILSRAVGQRSEYPRIFSAIVSLKARKLPYSENQYRVNDPANYWVCAKCRAFYSLSWQCPNEDCRSRERFADYSVIAHCADALLSVKAFPAEKEAAPAISFKHSFDVPSNRDLLDFMHVSQLWDEGSFADAFKLAYRYDFFVHGIGREAAVRAPLHGRLLKLLSEHATSVNGFTLTEVSGLRPRGLSLSFTAGQASGAPSAKKPKLAPPSPDQSRHGSTGPARQHSQALQAAASTGRPDQSSDGDWIVFVGARVNAATLRASTAAEDILQNLGLGELRWDGPPRMTNGGNLKLRVQLSNLTPNILGKLRILVEQRKVSLTGQLYRAANGDRTNVIAAGVPFGLLQTAEPLITAEAPSPGQITPRPRAHSVAPLPQAAAIGVQNAVLSLRSSSLATGSGLGRESSEAAPQSTGGRRPQDRPLVPALLAADTSGSGNAESGASSSTERAGPSNPLDGRAAFDRECSEPLLIGRILGTHVFKTSRRHGYLISAELAGGEEVTCFVNILPISGVDSGALVALKSPPSRGGDCYTLKGGTIAYAIEISHVSVKAGEWWRLH